MSAAQQALGRLRSFEIGDRVWALVPSYAMRATEAPLSLWCSATVQSTGLTATYGAVAVLALDEPVMHSSGLLVHTATVLITAMHHAY